MLFYHGKPLTHVVIKIGIMKLLNVAPPQKYVQAPGATIRGNTVCNI